MKTTIKLRKFAAVVVAIVLLAGVAPLNLMASGLDRIHELSYYVYADLPYYDKPVTAEPPYQQYDYTDGHDYTYGHALPGYGGECEGYCEHECDEELDEYRIRTPSSRLHLRQ